MFARTRANVDVSVHVCVLEDFSVRDSECHKFLCLHDKPVVYHLHIWKPFSQLDLLSLFLSLSLFLHVWASSTDLQDADVGHSDVCV